jgi:tetrahydromethanopterin S-methyltransferase subunit F
MKLTQYARTDWLIIGIVSVVLLLVIVLALLAYR